MFKTIIKKMLIPKIIHYTWKDENIPAEFQPFIASWKKHHPDWEFKLWTDETNRAFIVEYFPSFLEQYDRYPHAIQKADAIRYYILLHYGGVYTDVDIECYKNITPLLADATCIFGKEPDEHCQDHYKHMIITNAFMACTPHHSFMQALCANLTDVFTRDYYPLGNILDTTGPFMLTRLYEQLRPDNVVLLDHKPLFPLTKDEILLYLQGTAQQDILEKLSNAYAMHYYWGNWWRPEATLSLQRDLLLKNKTSQKKSL